MRNYFAALGLDRAESSSNRLKQSIESLSADELNDEDDLAVVLSDDEQCKHYRRVHLQYDAIAAALANPALSDTSNPFIDSHQWEKRVVEFEPDQQTVKI